MAIVKRLGTVAATAALAIVLVAPTGAWAGTGVVDGYATGGAISWGPSPPYYPHYHFGHYGIPVWGAGPFWEPENGCYRQTVWTGRHWRHARVCD